MEDILFIVHPYTYRIDNDGDAAITDQSSEMDFKIDLLTKQFFENKNRVIVSFTHHIFSEMSLFAFCEAYGFIYEDNLEKILIPTTGVPLGTNKPLNVDDETWANLRMVYTTEEKLKDLVPFHRDAYFIGGMLEACVSNFAIYWDKNHRTQNNNLFYIPELCVSQNVEARIRAEDILKERDILALTYEEAMERLAR